MEKKCSDCESIKPLTEFGCKTSNRDGLTGRCKLCLAEYQRQYRLNNKEKIIEINRLYRLNNKEKIAEIKKQHYKNNKENIEAYQKQYREDNKEKVANRKKIYQQNNKEKIAIYQKQYANENRNKINKHARDRRKTDPLYKLRGDLSTLMWYALKSQNLSRKKSFMKYVNYTIQDLYNHLKHQGHYDLTKPSIDHIIPQSLYDFSDEIEISKCWDLRNLRPMELNENSSKNNNLDMDLIRLYGIEDLLPCNGLGRRSL